MYISLPTVDDSVNIVYQGAAGPSQVTILGDGTVTFSVTISETGMLLYIEASTVEVVCGTSVPTTLHVHSDGSVYTSTIVRPPV